MLYTKTCSSLLPRGALHVNNPNYTETTGDSCFYYRTAPLWRQQGIYLPDTLREHSQSQSEEEISVQRSGWSLSAACSGEACVSRLPPPLFSCLVELFTCRSRRSTLVGRRSTKRWGLTQGNSKSHKREHVCVKGGFIQKQSFIYSSALPGKCDRLHEEGCDSNVV